MERRGEVFGLIDKYLKEFGIFEKFLVPMEAQASDCNALKSMLNDCSDERAAKRLKRDAVALNE
jgi:hypothetical protein